ncbi:MAG: RHS repeat-associated core domain-containing protein [Armatimonadota bacterium]
MLGDGQGTTRATVDAVQAVTSTFTSDGFGNPVAQWGSSANPYRYAGAWGYRDDGDAGLLHVGARYYDPQVGRFTSRDAVLSEHPYLYYEHEPIMRVDPSGEDDFVLDRGTDKMRWIYDLRKDPPIEWQNLDWGFGFGGFGMSTKYSGKTRSIRFEMELGLFWFEWDVKVPPRTYPLPPGMGSPYPPVVKPRVPGAPYEIYDPRYHGRSSNIVYH